MRGDGLDDGKIIGLFFDRDESAIEEVRNKYGKRLFRTAINILNNKEDAEECVSDTLLKAWESIPPSRPQILGAYLAKITRNRSLNIWEARKAAKRGGGEVTQLLGELEETVPSIHSTEGEYEKSLATAAINAFLTKADKTARVAFVLRYFHGESIADIATRFGMGESKIKSILFRLRKKLRVYLEKEGITL
jgi:RNA polymerase sigma-70 factor (ECF subfamily)